MSGEPPIYGRVTRRYGEATPPTYASEAVASASPATARPGPPAQQTSLSAHRASLPAQQTSLLGDRASWRRRAAGFVIDAAPGLLAVVALVVGYFLLLLAVAGDESSTATGSLPPHGRAAAIWLAVGGVLLLAMLGWAIPNRWLAGGRTGRSLGRRVMGLRLLSEQTGEPVGPGNAFVRDLVHCLDLVTAVGFLWPLWDQRRQTFADMIVQSVVVADQPPTGPAT